MEQSLSERSSLLDIIPEAYRANIEAWPAFDPKALNAVHRARYDKLSDGLRMLLAGQPTSEIRKAIPVAIVQFSRLLRRALSPKPSGASIYGLEAFAHSQVQTPRGRTKSFTPQVTSQAGYGGMFEQLLTRYPAIEAGLVDFANAKVRPNRIKGHVLKVEFHRLCREVAHLTESDYPFRTAAQGEEPLRRWFRTVYLAKHLKRHARREYGPDAAKALSYSDGDGQAFLPPEPIADWVLDEQDIDIHAKYEMSSVFGGFEEIELARFQIIRLRTVDLEMNLAWREVLAKKASAHDIAAIFFDALSGPRKLPAVVPGLDYMEGAGYPANAFEILRWRVPRVVWLDNALAHLADLVQNLVKRLWGGEMRLGAPATPKERAAIESSIKKHAVRVVHQLPATTGGHPTDPTRRAAEAPVAERVSVDALLHVLDVYFANENVTPNDSCGGVSAFTRVERMLTASQIRARSLPAQYRRAHWFSEPIARPVKVDLGSGRSAHANFMYTRYSSDILKRSFALHGKNIFLRPDYGNLQFVLAFDASGAEIGLLIAEGIWGRLPSDSRIRKMFGTHRKAGRLGPRADDQPLQTLFVYLRAGAKQDSTLALQLAYLTRYLCQHLSEAEIKALEMGGNVNLRAPIDAPAPMPWSEVKKAAEAATARASTTPPTAAVPPAPAPPPLRLISVPRHPHGQR